MTSVIIAAHNEEAVIGRCLDALAAQRPEPPEEVVVSANACTDDTVRIAISRGARVVDRPEAGKSAALNAGEEHLHGFPRVFLDADIVPPPHALASFGAVLAGSPGVCAVVPRRRLDTAGRPLAVRAYFAVNERLPAFTTGLFGRGLIVLSERGRARFTTFPDVLADDLFLDSLFADDEKAVAEDVEVVVAAPRTTRALLRRLVRVRRGNAQLRKAAEELGIPIRPSDKWAWSRVVLRRPWLAPAAVVYVVITLVVGRRARSGANAGDWGKDESTRSPSATRTDGGDDG